jgi:hypothetical protein
MNTNDGSVTVVATYSQRNTYPDNQDGLQSRTNANPAINWIAKVFATPQGLNITKPINVIVKIEYNVTFSALIGVTDV